MQIFRDHTEFWAVSIQLYIQVEDLFWKVLAWPSVGNDYIAGGGTEGSSSYSSWSLKQKP